MFNGINPAAAAIIAAVTFLACTVQGAAGFGAALILAPVLALLIDGSKEITVFLVLMGLIVNLAVLLRAKLKADVKKVLLMTLLSVFGILAGTYTLHMINAAALKIAAGAVTTISGLFLLFNYTVKVKKENAAYGGVGLLSGFLNASTGLSGPPVVLFLSNQGLEKDAYLSTISLYFLLSNVITLVVFFFSGTISMPSLRLFLWNAPFILAGSLLGTKISGKINGPLFRRLVICMIIALGAYLVIHTCVKL